MLLMIICVFTIGTRGEGIRFFKGSFQDALKQARAENKKVFVDFYTTWCGPCQLMSKNIFPDDEVGEYFNKYFVNYQINAEDKAFLPEVKRYGVAAYPNMLILDTEGNVLGRQLGATDKNGFLRFAKLASHLHATLVADGVKAGEPCRRAVGRSGIYRSLVRSRS